MNYLTIGELIDTLEQGDLETVAKQILLYGTITDDSSWAEQGDHHRHMRVWHHDVDWTIKKRNGWVHFVQPNYEHE